MSDLQRQFQRTLEDFECENCNQQVKGNGYTNHCPHCLWSKHVDVQPGDRAAECGGMMDPVSVGDKSGEYIITHRCTACGYEKPNRRGASDNFTLIIELASLTQG